MGWDILVSVAITGLAAFALWFLVKAKGAENQLEKWRIIEISTLVAYIVVVIPLSFCGGVTTSKNTITATYTADKDSSLLFTIPYDKGWTATQNGKKIALTKAQDGFMKVNVKAGQGQVTLTYVPEGFQLGACLSLAGVLVFSGYYIIRKKKRPAGAK